MEKHYDLLPIRRSRSTDDPLAQRINDKANQIHMAVDCGRDLCEAYRDLHGAQYRPFKAWCRDQVDLDWITVGRWMSIYVHRHQLARMKVVGLTSAYRALGIRDNVRKNDPMWTLAAMPDGQTE